jgi:addiction module HigA family antidote
MPKGSQGQRRPADVIGNAVKATRIGDILRANNPRAVSADTAMRLARYFGTTAQFWMNLQTAYDLSIAEAESGDQIERDVQPRPDLAA